MELPNIEQVYRCKKGALFPVDNFYLFIILVLGFVLRSYNISSLSLWVDEFVTTYKLFRADSLSEFFVVFNLYHSDQIPLSHLIFYSIFRIFSIPLENIEVLRWVSVLIGVINLVIFYVFVKLAFDKRIALLATLLFALSPFHILFAQMIRPYIFYEFAGVCSLLSTILLYKKISYIRGCFWVLTNILLFVSHYTGVLLILIEMGFIAIFFMREKKRIFFVFPVLLVGVTGCIFYFFTSRSVPIYTREDDFVMSIPSPYKWLVDLLADDAILTNEPFFHQGQNFFLIPAYWMNEITGLHYWFDTLLIIFSFFAIIYLVNYLYTKWKGECVTTGKPLFSILFFPFWGVLSQPVPFFLLAVVIAPVFILTVLTFLLWPCMQTRYTLYSSLALYPLVAFAVLNISHKQVRRILLIWLLMVFSYQAFISVASQKTTDFKKAGRIITQNSNRDEPILAWGIFYIATPATNEMLNYYIKNSDKKIIPVYSLSDTLSFMKRILTDEQKQSAWLVIEPFVFRFPDENIIETYFFKAGIKFEKIFLPGMNGLWLYHLNRTENSFMENFTIQEFIDYTPFLEILRRVKAPDEIIETARTRLKNHIDFYHPPTPMIWNYMAWSALDRDDPVLAEWFARCAIYLQPQTPWGYYSLTVSLMEQNRQEEALNSLNLCMEKDPTGIHRKHYYPIIDAIYISKDFNRARQMIKYVESKGGFINPIYKRKAGVMSSIE